MRTKFGGGTPKPISPISGTIVSSTDVTFECDREVNQLILFMYYDSSKSSAWIYTWTDYAPTYCVRYNSDDETTLAARADSSLTRSGNTYTFKGESFVVGRPIEVYAFTIE